MSQTLQMINLIILTAAVWFALHTLVKKIKANKTKKENDAEIKRWERGAQLASENKDYMAFVNDITGLGSNYDPATLEETINLKGKPYGQDEWRYTMPESAIRHLEECFEGNRHKVYHMKRAIELSIEHYTHEMEDDAQCARIIEERVYRNPQPSVPFDVEEYTRYRQNRKENNGDYETYAQWKQRHEDAPSQESAAT